MSFQIRSFEEGDYASIVELINRIEFPWQTTLEECRREYGSANKSPGSFHYVIIDSDSKRLIGHGFLENLDSSTSRKFRLELRVQPTFQGQGAGGLLWQRLWGEISERKKATVRTWVQEQHARGLEFGARRGFIEIRRSSPWRLKLIDMDPNFFELSNRMSARDVTIIALAEEIKRHPVCLREIHQLRNSVDADIPVEEPYPAIGYEAFKEEVGRYGVFYIARKGSEYVGLSCASSNPNEPGCLLQAITGTKAGYRKQGIAMALKSRILLHARNAGFESIVAYNESTNRAMCCLNEKMGFRRESGAILLEKVV